MQKTSHFPTALFFIFIAYLLFASTPTRGQSPKETREARFISAPSPVLPQEVEKAGIGGKVSVYVSVDEAGNVTKIADMVGPDWICSEAITPPIEAMRNAARDAALKAKFQPAMKNGKYVRSAMVLNFQFKKASIPLDTGTPNGQPRIVSAGILNGKAKVLAKPEYPAAAKLAEASGTVSIHVTIGVDGKVYSAEPVSGHALLLPAARLAACSSKFEPTLLQGHPVTISGIIVYNFVP